MARRSLANARVVVTGASSGIGRSLANQLAASQCKVLLNARREPVLQEVAEQIRSTGGEAEWVVGDVTSPETRRSIIDRCVACWGGIDILINNAGVGALGEFADADEERLRRVMEVNFMAPCELTRLALPYLKQGNSPLIVNIGSVLGHRAVPLKSEYCASKFAMHGWSDALRCEVEKDEIDVLLVSPSTTSSEFFEHALEDTTGKNWLGSSAQTPDYVAMRTIKAMRRGNHEIILSWGGWALVWLDRWMPTWANRLIARYGK